MISIRFEERQQIGLQYALETLHGCSPFGQEKIRKHGLDMKLIEGEDPPLTVLYPGGAGRAGDGAI